MESKENKFQQSENDGEVKTFEQRVFQSEKRAINDNHRQPMNTNEPPTTAELKKGSQGKMVMEAQRILKSNSDYIGYVDGDFGSITESAVKSFQRRKKLPITGIIDQNTWDALSQIRR